MSVIFFESLICCFISFACVFECCRSTRCFTFSKDSGENYEKENMYLSKNSDSPIRAGYDIIHENTECVICLEKYKPEEEIKLFGCGHYFHKKCYDEWSRKNNKKCPICQI